MSQSITKTIHIQATPTKVWHALTHIESMKQWMAEPEMDIEIDTDWKVGSPGFHHIKFENKGTVLHFEPNQILRYTYLSSISRLPDKPESYTITEIILTAQENETLLTLNLSNFPTETILKHIDFYWNSTLQILKSWTEKHL